MTEHGSKICRFSHSFSVGFTFPCWKISGLEHFLLEVISKEIVSINLWIYTCSGIIQEKQDILSLCCKMLLLQCNSQKSVDLASGCTCRLCPEPNMSSLMRFLFFSLGFCFLFSPPASVYMFKNPHTKFHVCL